MVFIYLSMLCFVVIVIQSKHEVISDHDYEDTVGRI